MKTQFERWRILLSTTFVLFLFAILLFSEATHMNDRELKKRLRNILLTQKQYVSKIIQDGIVEGRWDGELRVENVATLYLGIPITLTIELILSSEGVETDHFCQRMICLLERILEKRDVQEGML
jgi:hypothetical protein